MITPLTLKDELEKRFDIVKQASNDASFYRSLAEYVQYVHSNKFLMEIIEKDILAEYHLYEKKIIAARKKAMKECNRTYKELVRYVSAHHIVDSRIQEFLSDYKKITEGIVTTNDPTSFYQEIVHAVAELIERHFDPALKKYAETLDAKHFKMCTKFLFSPQGFILTTLVDEFKTQRRVKIWGGWIDIQRIYFALFEGRVSYLEDITRMLMLGNDTYYEFTKLSLNHVMDPQRYSTTSLESELLKRDLYTEQANRIHVNLCEALRRVGAKRGQSPERFFDFRDNTFYFKGQSIVGLNPERVYYKVFKIIYDQTQGEGGNVLYEKIKDGLDPKDIKAKDYRVTIRHAIGKGQGFFYYAKVDGKKISDRHEDKPFLQPLKQDNKIHFHNPYLS